MHLLEADADSNKTLCMAGVGISAVMKRSNVILLGDVADKQSCDEPHHAFIGGG